MNPFLVRPHDPLVFGTGGPFSAIPGARLDSFVLPPPTTLAGLVRTEAGRDAQGMFDTSRIDALLQEHMLGPILAIDGDPFELAAPQPADALRLIDPESHTRHLIRRLVPLALDPGDTVSDPRLAPVGQPVPRHTKPPRNAPGYWRMSALLDWLVRPVERSVPRTWGVSIPPMEHRTHVSVGPDGTVTDGALFGTGGRRFRADVDGIPTDLCLYGETSCALPASRHVVLGGEGRVSHLQSCPSRLPPLPDEVVASARAGFLRAYLLTPAPLHGHELSYEGFEVVAQCHDRAQVVSGWEMTPPEARSSGYPNARNARRRGGRPKAIRRLVPAGAVFFVSLPDAPDANERLARDLWARSLAEGQDARDGFARVLLGTWDGKLHPLNPEVSR